MLAETPLPSRRLTFRRMCESDLDDMARLLGDDVVMAHYPRPRTRDEALAWIRWNERGYARDGLGRWILEDTAGEFVGDCGLTWQTVDGTEELEVGYHVLPQRQGEGLASEARPHASTSPVGSGNGGSSRSSAPTTGPHVGSPRRSGSASIGRRSRTTSRSSCTPPISLLGDLGRPG